MYKQLGQMLTRYYGDIQAYTKSKCVCSSVQCLHAITVKAHIQYNEMHM